jgi:hypothetical protein
MKKTMVIMMTFSTLFFGACKKHHVENPGGETASMPGDNLDLYAVLDAFKSSKNLEGFEKSLNDKSKKINNLDLNTDGKVDYIKVVDNKDGDDHAITLRVPVSKTEAQDVAVIEIEKTGDKTASLQIIGDEKLYGSGVVIEPKSGEEKSGFVFTTVAVNVWDWPVVTYVYDSGYVVYVSPWDYEYYPVWYDPWEPVAWDVYYPVVYTYHSYYYPVGHPRFERANTIYVQRRVVSDYVMHHDYRQPVYHDNGRHNGNAFGPGNGNYGPRKPEGNMPRGQEKNSAPRMPQQNQKATPGNNQRTAPHGNNDHRTNSPMRNDQIRHQYPENNSHGNGGAQRQSQPHGGMPHGGMQGPRTPQQPHGGGMPHGGNHGGNRPPGGKPR